METRCRDSSPHIAPERETEPRNGIPVAHARARAPRRAARPRGAVPRRAPPAGPPRHPERHGCAPPSTDGLLALASVLCAAGGRRTGPTNPSASSSTHTPCAQPPPPRPRSASRRARAPRPARRARTHIVRAQLPPAPAHRHSAAPAAPYVASGELPGRAAAVAGAGPGFSAYDWFWGGLSAIHGWAGTTE